MGVFKMPSLGADMEAGRLVEWLVKPGDPVTRGDIVAVVETQKGAIEIEIFEEGVVQDLIAEIGQTLPVGAPLAMVRGSGETMPAPERASLEPPPVAVESGPALTPATPPVAAAKASPGMYAASPAARTRSQELGIDLSTVTGSGPDGAIVLADVEDRRGTEAAPIAPARPSSADEMRKAIAAAMTRAKRTIPHFYLSETIDVDPAIRFLDARNADLPPADRILLGALFVRAATVAAQKVPALNGHYVEEVGFHPSAEVNIGVAVALRGGGLVAPALIGAQSLDLTQTMAGMRDLVTRARAGRLRSSEMTRGTITVSSLGDTGAEAMTGVIFPPQAALLGLGAPRLRPWVVDGEVVPRHLVTLTLSADHRVSDGRQAARFIASFEAAMQNPEEL